MLTLFLAGFSFFPIFFICIFARQKTEKKIKTEHYHEKVIIYAAAMSAANGYG